MLWACQRGCLGHLQKEGVRNKTTRAGMGLRGVFLRLGPGDRGSQEGQTCRIRVATAQFPEVASREAADRDKRQVGRIQASRVSLLGDNKQKVCAGNWGTGVRCVVMGVGRCRLLLTHGRSRMSLE